MKTPFYSSLATSLLLFAALPAAAQISGISYPTRTKPYSGWSGIVKGDNNTLGMAGATVALPNSIAGMEYNPAGYAMNLGGLAAQINSFTNKEPNLNHGSTNYMDYEWGLGTSIPPWGFGLSYYSPTTEHSNTAEVSVRQVKLSVARMLGKNFALGTSIGFDKGIRKIAGQDLSGSHASAQIGALYKLDYHWVIGGSYSPGLTIGPTSNSIAPALASFNQDIKVPHLFALGVGFMPNRYFKAGFTLLGVTGTQDTALLYDQTTANGDRFTLQPRIGASYILGEWHFIKFELAAGSYFESTRIAGVSDRVHGTFGLDINPWFFNTGIGADCAKGYSNWSVSIGIDLVRTFRFFKVIPADPVPFYDGALPPIFRINANGLADGFTQGEVKTISPPSATDVKNILQDIPQKLNERFGGILPNAPTVETPKLSKIKRLRNRKRRKLSNEKNPPPDALKAIFPKPEHNDN